MLPGLSGRHCISVKLYRLHSLSNHRRPGNRSRFRRKPSPCISESAPAGWRGRLVALNQLAIVSGMLIIYLVNYRIHLSGTLEWNQTAGWRWMFASGVVPSALLLGLLFLVPETARLLLMHGREEAEKSRRAHRC
jgi:MFS family permease